MAEPEKKSVICGSVISKFYCISHEGGIYHQQKVAIFSVGSTVVIG